MSIYSYSISYAYTRYKIALDYVVVFPCPLVDFMNVAKH